MPINAALPRTEGGLTSDNVICPWVNRQKTHGWPGVARPKSWDCRCAELTASTEEKSNRRANKPASADFATKAKRVRSSCNLFAKEPDHSNRRKFYFSAANLPGHHISRRAMRWKARSTGSQRTLRSMRCQIRTLEQSPVRSISRSQSALASGPPFTRMVVVLTFTS